MVDAGALLIFEAVARVSTMMVASRADLYGHDATVRPVDKNWFLNCKHHVPIKPISRSKRLAIKIESNIGPKTLLKIWLICWWYGSNIRQGFWCCTNPNLVLASRCPIINPISASSLLPQVAKSRGKCTYLLFFLKLTEIFVDFQCGSTLTSSHMIMTKMTGARSQRT